jgi:predicted MFS family arabinose efflux permease
VHVAARRDGLDRVGPVAPARQTFVAEMVGTDKVINAQSLYSTVHNGGRLVGPALAGIVIAWLGVASAFAINALSFVAMIVAPRAMAT